MGCGDCEMVKLKILWVVRKAQKFNALGFRRGEFGLFKDLLGKVRWV